MSLLKQWTHVPPEFHTDMALIPKIDCLISRRQGSVISTAHLQYVTWS